MKQAAFLSPGASREACTRCADHEVITRQSERLFSPKTLWGW